MMGVELIVVWVILGAVVGLMAGLLGIGGGGILVPILTSVFIYQKFPLDHVVHLALGTSMACIMVTSYSSLRAHHAKGTVIWPLVWRMAPAIIIGTLCATFVAARLSGQMLAWFFSIFMAYVASQMFRTQPVRSSAAKPVKIELSIVATLIGAVSALVSIGGGSLTVPYLSWRSIEMRQAISTSAALGFPIALSGTLGYAINGLQNEVTLAHTIGYIYWPALLLISVSSYFTAKVGAAMAHRLPVILLKRIFGILLLLLSIKMLVSID